MNTPQPHRHRQCRILLVDDDADTREMLLRLLSRHYDVETAECYDSALATASATPPDIVVTDIGLPGRDGVSLMRELRKRHGVAGIAVTGRDEDDAPGYREAGFVSWLRKPIRFDALLRALDNAQATISGDDGAPRPQEAAQRPPSTLMPARE